MKLSSIALGLLCTLPSCTVHGMTKEKPFFQASQQQPYHMSVGAVLFDQSGRVACHHFKEIFGYPDIYILMRESMENDETVLMTLERGLIGHANHTPPLTEPGYNLLQKATGDEVRMLAKQILAEPQLSGALLRKIFCLRTFSLDNWVSRSKADWAPFVKDGLKAKGPLPKSTTQRYSSSIDKR